MQRDALEAVLEQRLLVLHDPGPEQQPHQAGQAFLQLRALVLAARAGRQQVGVALIDPQAAPDPQPSQPLLGHVLLGQEFGHLVEPPLDPEQVRDPRLDFVGLNGVEVVERADVGAGPLLQFLRGLLVEQQHVPGRVVVAVRDVSHAQIRPEEDPRRRHDPDAGQDHEHDPDDVEFQRIVPKAGDGHAVAVAPVHAAAKPLASLPPAVRPAALRRLDGRGHRLSSSRDRVP